MSSPIFERLNKDVAESLLKREIRAAQQRQAAVLGRGPGKTEGERKASHAEYMGCMKQIGDLSEELARLWKSGDYSALQQRLRNGEARLEVAPRKTVVVEIEGEAVLAFRADSQEEAECEVDCEESELGCIRDELLCQDRTDGRVLWDGESKLKVRLAKDAEHKVWLQSRDSAIGEIIDIGDDLDDWNVFLVKLAAEEIEESDDE